MNELAATGMGSLARSTDRVGPSAGAPGNLEHGEGRRTGKSPGGDGVELSVEAKKRVAELAQTDQTVRAHEAAHMAAGGGLVRGGAAYSFQRGPDGKNYAVAGEVTIDTSAVPDNPSATLQKAQQIKAAALAPADPSPQDRKVAAQASAMALKAASELAKAAKGSSRKVGSHLNVFA